MGSEKKDKEKEDLPDDTPIIEILGVILTTIRQTDLPEDDIKLLETWTEILNTNLYETYAHLRDIDADEWAAMKLPMRLLTVGKKSLFPDTGRLDLTSSSNSKKKNSKKTKHTPTIGTVKKTRSGTNLISEFARKKRTSLTDSGIQTMLAEKDKPSTPPENSSKVRMKVDETISPDKDKEKDKEKRRAFARTSSVSKLKSWTTKTKDDKEDDYQMSGDAIIGGLNNHVLNLLRSIKETSAIAGESSKDDENNVLQSLRVCNEQVDIKFKNCSQNVEEELAKEKAFILVTVFSVIDPRSLNNLMLQFLPLRKKQNNTQLMILVGIDANKRDPNDRKHISCEQAQQALKNLKGSIYLEIGEARDAGVLLQQSAKAILRREKSDRNKNSNWISKLSSLQKATDTKDTENITLKRCKLEFFPPQLLQFRHSLTRLKMGHNLFKFFPDEIMFLESLVDLDLSDNFIGDLPPQVVRHKTLTKLNLENNRIMVVPISVDALRDNFDLRLKGNPGYSQFQKIKKKGQEDSPRVAVDEEDETENQPRETPVFGTPLAQLHEYEQSIYPNKNIVIPLFVRRAINQILSSPLEQQGIFRMEGNAAQMQESRDQFDNQLKASFFKLENVNNVCGLLKLWLRMLPAPILGNIGAVTDIMNAEESERITKMKEYLSSLPNINFVVLSQVMKVLYIIASSSEIHKMDAQNLSTVMATNLVWSTTGLEAPTLEMLEQIQSSQTATTFLIQNYKEIFAPKNPFELAPLSDYENPKAVFHTKLIAKHRAITSVCFGGSSEGKRIWTADEKGVIHIWDAFEFNVVKMLDVSSRVNTLTATGDTIWVGTIENIQIHKAIDGELVKKIAKPGYNFAHAGSNILSCVYSNNEGLITCLDKESHEVVRQVKVNTRIVSIVATHDQVWASCQDKTIRVWDLETFEPIAEFDSIHEDKINHLCFVPKDGDLSEVWSSSEDQSVHVWNAKTRELEERLLSFHKKAVIGACCMGDQVWTYTWDAKVYMWDRETRDYLGTLCSYHIQPISSIVSDWEEGQESDNWLAVSVSYDHSAVVWKCRKQI